MATRRSIGVVAVFAVAMGVAAFGVPPASAETAPGAGTPSVTEAAPATGTPTVTVSPAVVIDRQTVTITASGFTTTGLHEFRQCRASDVTPPGSESPICRPLSSIDSGVPPTSRTTPVYQQFRSGSTTVDCVVEPGGCVVGLVAMTAEGGLVEAWAPVTFTPMLTAAPLRGLAAGDVVAVAATNLPAGSWTVAQCGLEGLYVPEAADSSCAPAVPLVRRGRRLVARVTVHDPVVAVDGTETICRYESCALVVRASDGSVRTGTFLSFGEPVLSTGWKSQFEPGEVVPVTLFGLPGRRATVRQCAGTPGESTCDDGVETPLDPWGYAAVPRTVERAFTASDGTAVDCTPGSCALVAEVDGEVVALSWIGVAYPASIALTPDSGLLEGQPMTLTATGLPPSEGFAAYRCADTHGTDCEGMGTAWSDATGALTLESTATQRVGERSHCGVGCGVLLRGNYLAGTATYTMAEATVSAVPSTGLIDGDQVRVAGSDLLPTYAGPSYGPYPTGDWHVLQCEIDQLVEPDLHGIFDHCGAPVPVTVTGSTAEADLVVHASMTTMLGGTVDCTRPGACGVGFYRLESNGVSTLWSAPIDVDA